MLPPSPDDDYTEFSDIDSGISNNTTEGLIEIEATGTGFRYRKQLVANLPFTARTIRDDWWIRVEENAGGAGKILFEQRVTYGIHVVADESIPGLPIYIAYPAENEMIETTIIDGQAVAPGEAKAHLDLNYQTEFGITEDFVANPGADGLGVVTGTWESLPYVMEIPEGAVFKIIHDGWRPIGLSRIATYQTSYKPGEGDFDALLDHAGGLRVAIPESGAVAVQHTYRGAPLQATARFPKVTRPSIYKAASNRMYLAGLENREYRLWFSRDDGRNWTQLTTKNAEGATVPVSIFDDTFRNQRVMMTRAGVHIASATKDEQVWIKLSYDGILWSGAYAACPAKSSKPYKVQERDLSGVLWLTNGIDHVLKSNDGGRSFKDKDSQ